MAFSRYARTPILGLGSQYGTSEASIKIRQAIANGSIRTTTTIVRGVERLDTLAGVCYNDSRAWWILAAASNIGWALQVPPGTIITIPDINDIAALLS